MSLYHPIIEVPLDGDPVTVEGIPNADFQTLLESIQEAINGKVYTVATVPSATTNQSRIIFVSNASIGGTIAWSDGTNWKMPTAISTLS